jgi:hypothetical protein
VNAAPGKRGSNSSSMVSPRQPTKHSKPHASTNYSSVAGNIQAGQYSYARVMGLNHFGHTTPRGALTLEAAS